MILIGLTGNIASGKSEVARMLADRGATVIDADVLAREAVEPDTQALKDIVKRWGKDVLAPDGSLNRRALRQVVFADQAELDALNRIVHPGVTRLRDREIAAARARGLEETDAMNMIAAQMPAELKRARADYVIENVGSLADLERDIDALWSSLHRDAAVESETAQVS